MLLLIRDPGEDMCDMLSVPLSNADTEEAIALFEEQRLTRKIATKVIQHYPAGFILEAYKTGDPNEGEFIELAIPYLH